MRYSLWANWRKGQRLVARNQVQNVMRGSAVVSRKSANVVKSATMY